MKNGDGPTRCSSGFTELVADQLHSKSVAKKRIEANYSKIIFYTMDLFFHLIGVSCLLLLSTLFFAVGRRFFEKEIDTLRSRFADLQKRANWIPDLFGGDVSPVLLRKWVLGDLGPCSSVPKTFVTLSSFGMRISSEIVLA